MDSTRLDPLEFRAFQEGFETLSRARSMEDFAKRFCHIARGSLTVSYVNLYTNRPPDHSLQPVFVQKGDRVPVEIPDARPFDLHSVDAENAIQIRIVEKDGTSFCLLVGPRVDRRPWSPLDELLIHLFCQLFDHGYQSFTSRRAEQQLTFSLNQRILQLNQLIDTGIELSRLKRSGPLLGLAVQQMAGLLNASVVEVRVRKGGTLVFEAAFPKASSETVSEDTLRSAAAIRKEFSFGEETFEFTAQRKESRSGWIPFDETDRAILDAVVRQVFAAVENDYLQAQLLDKRDLERELHLASLIQKKILPTAMPHVDGYEIAGTNIPSKEVSGDYFDCFLLGNGEVVVIVADVAGKGFPASLLVSTLHASVHTSVVGQVDLSDLASRLNDLIFRSSTPDCFVTFFMGILNPSTGIVRCINAGHPPPLVQRPGGTLEPRRIGGLPLGCFDTGCEVVEDHIELTPGARLLLFTDGIPEAQNGQGAFYSDEAFEEFFLEHPELSASSFIEAMVGSVKTFCGSASLSDDVTLLYVRHAV